MRQRLETFLRGHGVRTDGDDYELALRAIHASGTDVRSLSSRTHAYVMAYAESRLDAVRLDEWNPDQPRDEHGMFSGGEGTQAGAVKSGVSAAAKAESVGELLVMGANVNASKLMQPKAKGEVFSAMAAKAAEMGDHDVADKYSEKAQNEFAVANIQENDAHAAEDNPDLTEAEGLAAQAANAASDKVLIPSDDIGEAGIEEAVSNALGPDAVVETSEDGESVTVTMPDGKVFAGTVGSDDDHLELKAIGIGPDIGSEHEFDGSNHVLLAKQGDQVKLEDQATGDIKVMTAAELSAKVKSSPEVNPPANPNKTPEHAAHAKAARDAAKEAVLTGKALRAQLKKDPTNKQLAEHVASAEKAAKAARSAARKAEKAPNAKEAAKHAAKAQEHADKVSQLNKSAPESDGPTVITAAQQAAAKPKAAKGSHAVDPATTKALQKKADKLKEAANTPHPESWTAEKIAAKEAAQKALVDHADPTTPDELKAAADALDKVAAQASAAGSYWGSSYKSLADEYRDAATPKETYEFASGGADDHSQPPGKSARPIDSIKGELVTTSAHAEHRKQFTAALKTDEKKAALKYSGSAYGSINSNLRADGKPDKTVHDLDKAIAKAPAPKDMLVHRGVSGTFAEKLYAGLKPGDQIVEKAYSSTSAGGNAAFGGGVEMHITVPKGYPAAPIPSHHPGEREYLLRRNTKFQVTKIEKVGHKIIAHLTVVHDKA